MGTVQVVFYSHACFPRTTRAREYPRAQGLAFGERDVADPDAAAEMRRRNAWATPMHVVGDRWTMVGFDEREFALLPGRAREDGVVGA